MGVAGQERGAGQHQRTPAGLAEAAGAAVGALVTAVAGTSGPFCPQAASEVSTSAEDKASSRAAVRGTTLVRTTFLMRTIL